ncbi:hypothetical protein [Methylobacterium durans]|uniref:Uncharacterized protein n=1 Tax=Methylobacterium durans TaxID=2202825 RepID=A0A2U8WEA5_9HYPH|nr:hypothetical protein [Methylobacterium durans]AWN43810.1 hypothetical protein DK389_28940 [Methylobacterium durans]
MSNTDEQPCAFSERLLAILDEDIPSAMMGRVRQFRELLDLENAAHSAGVAPWLLNEIRTARDTTGWVMLTALDDEAGH